MESQYCLDGVWVWPQGGGFFAFAPRAATVQSAQWLDVAGTGFLTLSAQWLVLTNQQEGALRHQLSTLTQEAEIALQPAFLNEVGADLIWYHKTEETVLAHSKASQTGAQDTTFSVAVPVATYAAVLSALKAPTEENRLIVRYQGTVTPKAPPSHTASSSHSARTETRHMLNQGGASDTVDFIEETDVSSESPSVPEPAPPMDLSADAIVKLS
jgi:hypothetical protein